MKQETFTDIEYSYRKKKTKREEFLEIMDEIIPWDEWVGVIEPYYPKGKRGRPPMGIEKMLRMYLLQIWFNLSDPATEDAIYDSYAMPVEPAEYYEAPTEYRPVHGQPLAAEGVGYFVPGSSREAYKRCLRSSMRNYKPHDYDMYPQYWTAGIGGTAI